MPSRKRFLISPGAWLALASLTACVDTPDESKGTQPPPVVGMRQKTNPAQTGSAAGTQGQATSTGVGMRVLTTPEADGGSATLRDAAHPDMDMDAGPASAGSAGESAAGAAAAGRSARAAAGSGGRGGTGGMRAAGSGGRGGAGGQAGAQSDACMNQLCFTIVDCWLLTSAECSFSECDNFICK